MPRSSGTYSAPASSWSPAVSGNAANFGDWNTLLADISAALTQSLSQDGQTNPTANLPMAGFKHTGVGNASGSGQYIAWGQACTLGAVTLTDITASGTATFNGTLAGTGFAARFSSPGPIGNTTASTGAFTTVTASTSVTSPIVTAQPTSNGDGIANVSSTGTGAYAYLRLQNNGVTRWQLTKTNSSEAGSNVGSDFQLQSFTDAGAFLVNALSISRATGQMAAGITPAIGDNSLNVATTADVDRAAFKGASWQSSFGSRVKTTVYTNSTGRPIAVTIRASGASTGDRFRLVSNGSVVAGMSNDARSGGTACMLNSVVIPDGATYAMEDDVGTCTIVAWTELRT